MLPDTSARHASLVRPGAAASLRVTKCESAVVQIVNLEFSPGEFEEHVLGCKQDWRQSLLVEVGQQSHSGLQQALPLGPWLHQQGISVDDEGRMLSSAQPSRFAREAGLEAQPSLSGPPAHCAARWATSLLSPAFTHSPRIHLRSSVKPPESLVYGCCEFMDFCVPPGASSVVRCTVPMLLSAAVHPYAA